MLSRYCIGSIDPSESNARVGTPVLQYREGESTLGFYPTLKGRVEAYFRENKLDPRVHPHMFLKTAAILGGYWACYYLTFFAANFSALSVAGALGMGMLTAQVGASIMHDANHGNPFGHVIFGQANCSSSMSSAAEKYRCQAYQLL